MKLAKASQDEIDRLMSWLQARENSNDPPPPYMRIVFGYETLLDHCADPAATVLEFKPEILQAKAIVARLPKTKDGVPIVIGDKVWIRLEHEEWPFHRATEVEVTSITKGASFPEYCGAFTICAESDEFGNEDCYSAKDLVPRCDPVGQPVENGG